MNSHFSFCALICFVSCFVFVTSHSADDLDWKVTELSQEVKELKELSKMLAKRVDDLENSQSNCQKASSSIGTQDASLDVHHSEQEETSNASKNKTIEERLEHVEELSKINSLRSCAEYAAYGMTQSGMYNIDPDGQLVGLPGFDVFCNFSSGTTEILHDKEFPVDITPCEEDFCYRLNVTYTAPMDQITALMDLSETCYQDISFSCFLSALSIGEEPVGLWINRHNQMETYFTGSHHGQHICECGLDGTCSDSDHGLQCNCDASFIPELQLDSGTIDNVTALPIMGFAYGHMKYESQMALIQIGRLVCEGTKKIPKNEVASSCSNLKRSGVVESGNFILNGAQVAYCDMDKLVDDDAIQTYVGDLSYKSSMFYASTKDGDGYQPSGRISFDNIEYDYNGNFDKASGTFTATRDGLYAFFFNGYFGATTSSARTKYIDVYVNDEKTMEIRIYGSSGYSSLSITEFWTLNLIKGNTVHLDNRNGQLFINSDRPMNFMGYYID